MGRRSTSGKPAVYVAYRREPAPGKVFGTFVSCPGDLTRDTERLYGAGAEAVSRSACPTWLLEKARLAEAGGRPVPFVRVG